MATPRATGATPRATGDTPRATGETAQASARVAISSKKPAKAKASSTKASKVLDSEGPKSARRAKPAKKRSKKKPGISDDDATEVEDGLPRTAVEEEATEEEAAEMGQVTQRLPTFLAEIGEQDPLDITTHRNYQAVLAEMKAITERTKQAAAMPVSPSVEVTRMKAITELTRQAAMMPVSPSVEITRSAVIAAKSALASVATATALPLAQSQLPQQPPTEGALAGSLSTRMAARRRERQQLRAGAVGAQTQSGVGGNAAPARHDPDAVEELARMRQEREKRAQKLMAHLEALSVASAPGTSPSAAAAALDSYRAAGGSVGVAAHVVRLGMPLQMQASAHRPPTPTPARAAASPPTTGELVPAAPRRSVLASASPSLPWPEMLPPLPRPEALVARSQSAAFLPAPLRSSLAMVPWNPGAEGADGVAGVREWPQPEEPERLGVTGERQPLSAAWGRADRTMVPFGGRGKLARTSSPLGLGEEFDITLDLGRHETRRQLREWLATENRAAQVLNLLKRAPAGQARALTDVLARLLLGDDASTHRSDGLIESSEGGGLLEMTHDVDEVHNLVELADYSSGGGGSTSTALVTALVRTRGSEIVLHEAPLVPVPALNLDRLPAESQRARPGMPKLSDGTVPTLRIRNDVGGGASSSGGSRSLHLTVRSSHPDHAEIVSVRLGTQEISLT